MKSAALKMVEVGELYVPGVALLPRSRAKLQLVPKLKCCANDNKCANIVRFRIDDMYLCTKHSDQWWEDHFVDEHLVRRVGSIDDDD